MRVLVTGGRGFLGAAVVRQLVARGDIVRSLARGTSGELAALGVEQHVGDLADPAVVSMAVNGVDAVVHVAARAGVWGPYEDFRRTNVEGTRQVINACRVHGVGKLVYTSSPSVVFDGSNMEGVDESVPYPKHYHAAYPATKAEAERMVLAANGPDLATVALRPHLIWGLGDNHLVPRIIARARAGRLRPIGKGTNKVDSIYIDNAADAHLLALDRLHPGSPISGNAYFLSNGEPLPLWDLVDRILAAAGLGPISGKRRVPAAVAWGVGAGCEAVYALLRRSDEPPMTRFVAGELATAHWFDLTAARRDLGYEPRVSIAEGLRRLAEALHGSAATSVQSPTR